MTSTDIALLALLVFIAGLLYSSVGHAGASGYLASMALFGLAPSVMKPTALALNVLVAAIATTKFHRAGYFSWPIFWPFAVTSIPFAFLGGHQSLNAATYKPLVGLVLVYAAFRLFHDCANPVPRAIKPVPLPAALLLGMVLGFLSGLTGVGGGIFLSPLLLLMSWAETRQTSGTSAAFILVNSLAGLGGHLSSLAVLPGYLPILALAAAVGGWIGSEYGSRRLAGPAIRRLLALVLVVAAVKMFFV